MDKTVTDEQLARLFAAEHDARLRAQAAQAEADAAWEEARCAKAALVRAQVEHVHQAVTP